MLSRYDALISRLASYRFFLVFFVLLGLFGGLIMPLFESMLINRAGQAVELLDLQFGFAPEAVHGHLTSYGESGRPFYMVLELTADVVYPMVYTLFFSIALFLFYRRSGVAKPVYRLHRLPLIVILLDYLENLSIVALLALYPSEVYWLAVLCSALTVLKWVSVGLVVVLILFGLIRQLAGLLKPARAQV